MRKFKTLALAVLLVACSPKQQTETKDMNQHQALRKHPEYALKNAKKYF